MGFMAEASTKRPRNSGTLTSVRVSDGSTPRFLQGPFEFEGNGLDKPSLIDESLRYVVPPGAVTQPVYSKWLQQSPPIETTILAAPGQIELHLVLRSADPAAAEGWVCLCDPLALLCETTILVCPACHDRSPVLYAT